MSTNTLYLTLYFGSNTNFYKSIVTIIAYADWQLDIDLAKCIQKYS